MTQVIRTPEALSAEPDIEFLFWRHIDQNVPDLVQELEDKDVLLLEISPLTAKRTRLKVEALLNVATGAELTPKQMSLIDYESGGNVDFDALSFEHIEGYLATTLPSGDYELIKRLVGSGKTIRFLDTNPTDNPDVDEIISDFITQRSEINNGETRGVIKNYADMVKLTKNYVMTEGKAIDARDEVIVGQIESYAREFSGQKIAVVYGANHTAISHPFIRQGQATRTFVDQTNKADLNYLYTIDSEVVRRARFGREIPDELIARQLFKSNIYASLMSLIHQREFSGTELAEQMVKFDPNALSLSDFANDYARSADMQEVEQYERLTDDALKAGSDEALRSRSEFLNKIAKKILAASGE